MLVILSCGTEYVNFARSSEMVEISKSVLSMEALGESGLREMTTQVVLLKSTKIIFIAHFSIAVRPSVKSEENLIEGECLK